jgi:hypothetical protein
VLFRSDIEKEDWINYFNSDKARTPIILQMVLNGTPVEDAILLVNQPIIQHYLRSSKVGDVGASLGQKGKKANSYILDGLKTLGIKPIMQEDFPSKVDMPQTITMILNTDYFSKHLVNFTEKNYPPYVRNDRKGFDAINETAKKGDREAQSQLAAQIAFLTQYMIVKEQNDSLLKLTANVDFNTNSYRSITDFFSNQYGVQEARQMFNDDAVDKILNNSVVSPFNIVDEALTISNQLFDVVSLPVIQDNIQEWLKTKTFWGTEKKLKEVNTVFNGFMHLLIQQYGTDKTKALYTEYGRDAGFFRKSSKNNLKNEFIRLFRDNKNQELKDFSRNNLFLSNFTTTDIKNSDRFYITMKSNEKDPDTVDAVQKAFMDGLNHPNPEVVQFFSNVANATIVSQGFNIRYRSIQPYLPIQSYIDVAAGLSETLKAMKTSYNEAENKLSSPITSLLEEHIKTSIKLNERKPTNEVDKFFPLYTKEEVAKLQPTNATDFLPGEEDEFTGDADIYEDNEFYEEDSLNAPVMESTEMTIARKSQPSTSVDNTSKPVFNSLPNKSSVLTMTYAGIGSRQTPSEVLKQMTEMAKQLESKGYTLNTGITFRGKEEGADKAFSDGTTKKNLFSPEKQGARAKEQTIAKEMHPNPGALSGGGLKLMARNTNQVFGDNLDKPVDFVLFYAKETSNPLRPEGGTGQAVEMARRKGIPTINMADINWRDQLEIAMSTQPSTTPSKTDSETVKCRTRN